MYRNKKVKRGNLIGLLWLKHGLLWVGVTEAKTIELTRSHVLRTLCTLINQLVFVLSC